MVLVFYHILSLNRRFRLLHRQDDLSLLAFATRVISNAPSYYIPSQMIQNYFAQLYTNMCIHMNFIKILT